MDTPVCICGHRHHDDVIPFAVIADGCTDEACECMVLEPSPDQP